MDIEEDIKRMKEIMRSAVDNTPEYINGIIIPNDIYYEFKRLLWNFMKSAKFEKKYYQHIYDTTNESQKATNDFITSLCEGINDGTVKFGK